MEIGKWNGRGTMEIQRRDAEGADVLGEAPGLVQDS